MQKWVFFWAAGIGFTSMQIFLYLHSLWARIVYTLVALAGLWCVTLLFRARDEYEESSTM